MFRKQRPHPVVYKVTLSSLSDEPAEVTYTVMTYLAEEKAVVLAVEAMQHDYPNRRVYDVLVEEVGPAGRKDGMVDLDSADWHDRMEF
jgi:hypothetical protein